MAQGGKTFQDRELAANVRKMSLDLIQKYLEGSDEEFKKQLILRLATSILPKLNEHTGADGEAIEVKQITGMQIIKE